MVKKKIGILTYHRSVNYGAFMQAYSLSMRLHEEFPETEVEIIDYISSKTYRIYHKSVRNYISLIISGETLHEKARYAIILVQYMLGKNNTKDSASLESVFKAHINDLPLSKDFIVTDNLDDFFQRIKGKYDVIVVGSDAVWNWQIRKFPNPYFLGKGCTAIRMSYAASSFGQDYLKISDDEKRYIHNAWSEFSYIGVRDLPTENFVKMVAPEKEPFHNCDPTVFLDVNQLPIDINELKKRLTSKGIDLNKPIIGLMCKPWLATVVKKLFDNEYQIVAVFFDNQECDAYIDNLAPFEWARVFSLFTITFTHFFHGNLLSLRNGTPTIPIEKRTEYNQTHDSKVRDLMKRLGLFEWCFYEDEVESNAERIKALVNDIVQNKEKYTSEIFEALDIEATSFDSFKYALEKNLRDNNE